jgi:FlaA1/EpsC-like NDP-sugar epimerase
MPVLVSHLFKEQFVLESQLPGSPGSSIKLMKFNQIILLILLASVLMVLLYQLLGVIDHNGSSRSVFILLMAVLADLVIMIRSFFSFMKQPSEKN